MFRAIVAYSEVSNLSEANSESFWTFAEQLLKQFGLLAIATPVLLAAIVTVIAHWRAEPGKEVSIFWGMFRHTKRTSQKVSAAQPPPINDRDTSAPAPLQDSERSSQDKAVEFDFSSLFEPNNPFPKGYDLVKLGTPMSVVKSIYPAPDGQFFGGGLCYMVDFSDGPIARINYFYRGAGPDPKIRSIVHTLRAGIPADKMRKALVSALKSHKFRTTIAGNLVWDDVVGTKVEIDSEGQMWINELGQ